jgi:membrane-associated protein
MATIIHFITDPRSLISSFGLIGIIAIVFLETGFFFGFFFPGDSLLFTAGLLASQGYLPLAGLAVGAFIAAVLGDSVGYAFGKKVGPALFSREDSKLFKREHLAHAQHFYEKYGVRTIVLARFIPIVRTFAPIVAGIGAMEYKRFLRFNIIGGLLWTVVIIGLGYGFGSIIPDPDKYLLPAIGLIIIVSVIPAAREIWKRRRTGNI